MSAQVFVTTYNLYNSGYQFATPKTGFWIDVDQVDTGELHDQFVETEQSVLKDDLIDDVELMFTDYEGFPEALYCESGIDFELVNQYCDLSEDEQKLVDVLMDHGIENDLEDAIKKAEDCHIFEGSRGDYAYDMADMDGQIDGMGWLGDFIDWDAVGRAYEMDGILTEIAYNEYLVDYNR